MCGIFGGVALRRPLHDECERAMRLLAHRGPDGSGSIVVGNAALAHTRLRVIDISEAADQPLWDARRQAVIVFNGEIYNYRELKAECLARGATFHTSSDTEVIVNAYLLFGAEAFARLNGMFAFCLYDTRTHDAFLVRDRWGIKPLYYAPAAGGVLFSSELRALTQTAGVDTTLDRDALQAYLQLDFVPAPLSIVTGVRKLEAGCFLRVSDNGVVERRSFVPARQLPRAGDVRTGTSSLQRVIDDAVGRQLVSDVPVGVFLSGGIDSTIIAESAARLTEGRIAAFSIAFDHPTFDESPYFAEVGRALGIEHHVRRFSSDDMVALVPEVAARMDEPLADGSIYPTTLLARFARERVTVALSGDGADELFGGYPTYLAHGIARRIPAFAMSLLRASGGIAHRILPARFDNLTRDYLLKKFLDGLHPNLVERHARWMGSFAPDELRQLLVSYEPEAQGRLVETLMEPARETGDGWLEQLLRTDQRFYLQDDILTKTDRASMSCSLEVRVPFLDPEVTAFADTLGSNEKVRGRRTKAILRDCVARRFPPSISKRAKKGFGAPLAHWFRGELKSMLQEVFSKERVAAAGIFKPEAVQRLLHEHWDGTRDHRKKIFNLLAFTLWQETLT